MEHTPWHSYRVSLAMCYLPPDTSEHPPPPLTSARLDLRTPEVLKAGKYPVMGSAFKVGPNH